MLATDSYPTRLTDHPMMLQREDPVVYGPAGGRLDRDQVESFDRNGYLFLPGLLGAGEVQSLLEELRRLQARPDNENRPEVVIEPESREIRSVFRIHRDGGVYEALSRDARFVDPVRQLLDSDVYVHQSRINYKPGFRGKEFYWHSDFETWHAEDGMPRMRCISCSILLTENNDINGALMVVPGSHRTFVSCVGATPPDHYRASLRRQEYGVPDDESLTRLINAHGYAVPKGPAGSVLFFDCNLLHGSGSNISPFPRSNVFFVYNSVENRLVQPFAAPNPRPEFLAER